MTNPDPLLMSADIAIVEAERPDLDVELIAAMYRHVLAVEGRQPTLAEFRAYVDHVSCLGTETLRAHLGIARAAAPGRRAAPVGPPTGATPIAGRGRPRGTRLLTRTTVPEAYRAFQREHGRRPTQEELASRLDVAVRSLQRFLRDHGMGWPLDG